MKRVLVCGGRNYGDAARVYRELDAINEDFGVSVIIHGGASGADSHAGTWAVLKNFPCIVFKADWNGEGRAAGPKRNERMLGAGRPDLVVAFPGGNGTADMVQRAKKAGVMVKVVKP